MFHNYTENHVQTEKLISATTTSSPIESTTVLSHTRMPIVVPNFPRVAIPFVVAIWVFSASLVKIGKYK